MHPSAPLPAEDKESTCLCLVSVLALEGNSQLRSPWQLSLLVHLLCLLTFIIWHYRFAQDNVPPGRLLKRLATSLRLTSMPWAVPRTILYSTMSSHLKKMCSHLPDTPKAIWNSRMNSHNIVHHLSDVYYTGSSKKADAKNRGGPTNPGRSSCDENSKVNKD